MFAFLYIFEEGFSKMKKGVCFINAGRGDHVHENDLLIACQSNIKLAILDVF